MTDPEPDVTEKVERTETGFRLTVESTRGTGTRDQDKVKVESRTETLRQLRASTGEVKRIVEETLEERRDHQPDEEDGGDDD